MGYPWVFLCRIFIFCSNLVYLISSTFFPVVVYVYLTCFYPNKFKSNHCKQRSHGLFKNQLFFSAKDTHCFFFFFYPLTGLQHSARPALYKETNRHANVNHDQGCSNKLLPPPCVSAPNPPRSFVMTKISFQKANKNSSLKFHLNRKRNLFHGSLTRRD